MKFEPKLYRLSNGIPVILDQMDIETTYARIGFATGARDEQPQEYGLTHFCEHMFFAGTKRFKEQKERKLFLDDNGGAINAFTDVSEIVFEGRIIADNLFILLDVIADQLQNSVFDTDKIANEKHVVLDELRRAQDRPERIMSDFLCKSVFNNWFVPNGLRILGSDETINSFTREQIISFIQKRLSAKNCVICISGKINDVDETVKYLDNLFSFLPTHEVSQNTDLKYTPAIAHNTVPDKSNIRLELLWPGLYDCSLENDFNRKCLGKFERYLIQELFQKLRQEKGFVYNISNVIHGNEKFELNGFATQTSVQNIEEMVTEMAKNVYKIYSENPITAEDLQRFINKDRLEHANFLEKSGSRATRLYNYMQNFGVLYDFEKSKQLSNSITVQDIFEKTRGYFDGQMSVVTQGVEFNSDLKQVWIDNFK